MTPLYTMIQHIGSYIRLDTLFIQVVHHPCSMLAAHSSQLFTCSLYLVILLLYYSSMFGVTILGNNSALPAYDRHPTAQVITLNQFQFLIDCGEGTQMQLARYKVRRSRINHVFISHLHGDHYFGLPGLITSMGLLGRDTDLHLFAPPELQPILDLILQAADTRFGYTLHF